MTKVIQCLVNIGKCLVNIGKQPDSQTLLLSDSDHAETREGSLPMGLTDFFHTFLSYQPPFPAYRKHAVLWALTQEPGDSAAIKLQQQEATERPELDDIPKCPQLSPVLQDNVRGSQLPAPPLGDK